MSTTTNVFNSISFQGMPNLGVPMVGADGVVALAWYRFFISLYNVTLAGLPTLPAGVAPGNPNSLTLAGIFDTTSGQGGQISNQGTLIAANTISIATLTSDVVVLQNEINALQGQVATLQGQVATLQAQVDGLTVLGTAGSATAGGGGAPPATVTAYMAMRIGATTFRVPLYLP